MEPIIRREQAAKILQLPMGTLNYLVSTGQIPYFRIGKRSVRFSEKKLEQWLTENENREYRLKKKD